MTDNNFQKRISIRIRDQFNRHPLVIFVILAYTISSVWLLNDGIDFGTINGFGIIGSTSPALAAMIVSYFQKSESTGLPPNNHWRLFGIVCILVLAVMAGLRLWVAKDLVRATGITVTTDAYPSFTAFLVDILAAVVVAFIISGIHSQRQGVRDLLGSINPRHQSIRWWWWAVAIGLYPVVFALGNVISTGIGLPEPAPKVSGLWFWLVPEVLIMFLYYLFGGGGLEEPGWRGFALPLLQKRYSPFCSSMILTIIWAFWHWPMFWPKVIEGGPLVVVFFMLQVAPLAILFTAVFNRTGSNLLIAIVMHTSINITDTFLPMSAFSTILWMILMLGLALWMWRCPQFFSSSMMQATSNVPIPSLLSYQQNMRNGN